MRRRGDVTDSDFAEKSESAGLRLRSLPAAVSGNILPIQCVATDLLRAGKTGATVTPGVPAYPCPCFERQSHWQVEDNVPVAP